MDEQKKALSDDLEQFSDESASIGKHVAHNAQEQNDELFHLIINTAARTVFFLVALVSLLSALLVALFPLRAGEVYYNLGMTARAFTCLEKAYLREGETANRLSRLNGLSELSIELMFDRIDRGKNSSHYANKVILYGNQFLNTPGNDIFSADLNEQNIMLTQNRAEHKAIANHRGYISRSVLQAYVSFGRNEDLIFVKTDEIREAIKRHFSDDFVFQLNNSSTESCLDNVFPDWSWGVVLNSAFNGLGLEPILIVPCSLDEIKYSSTLRLDYFSDFYKESGGYTQTYKDIESAYKSVNTIINYGKAYINNESRALKTLMYIDWSISVATDLYLMNAIMMAQDRHNWAPDNENVMREMDKWGDEIRLKIQSYNEHSLIYEAM